jgi:hypothetical protein
MAANPRARKAVRSASVGEYTADTLSKRDYIILAILLLGGVDNFVDAEDIAVECYKINPPMFRWVKYDYPNLGTVLDALRNIRKETESSDYLLSPKTISTQYRLTARGLEHAVDVAEKFVHRSHKSIPALVRAVRAKFDTDKSSSGRATSVDVNPRQALAKLRAMTNHPTYRAWRAGQLADVQRWQLTDVLQSLPDSPQSVIRERLLYYAALARWTNRPQIERFVASLATTLGQKI